MPNYGFCDTGETMSEELDQTMLEAVHIGNNSIDMSLSGGACKIFAEAFARDFVLSGAKNYLEMTFIDKDLGEIMLTLQRKEGKTPHQLRIAAEAQRDELLSVLSELEESAGYWSEYDVPLGIVDRIKQAIAKCQPTVQDAAKVIRAMGE